MKKKLEAELISIAHRILKLTDRSTLPQLQEEAKQLYEKLTILNFTEKHFSGPQPTIGQVLSALEKEETVNGVFLKKEEHPKPVIEPVVSLDKMPETETVLEPLPEVKEEIKEEPVNKEQTKPEIVIEEINEKVSEDLFVPKSTPEPEKVESSQPISSKETYHKNDFEEITAGFDKMPVFEKVSDQDDKPKSINDRLKKDISIGLNDRLAFIKHLFNGSSTDYNRVLSQLNTLNSKSGARQFIKNMVKPDYKNWEGKEEFEERFMEIVTSKYEF